MFIRLLGIISVVVCCVNAQAQAQIDVPQKGSYEITSTVTEILGGDLAASYANQIDTKLNITWEINVADDYDPNNPPGVMVYISPQNIVNLPTGWLDVTKDKNLIFIAARMSGNRQATNIRIIMALLALPLVQSKYNIDLERIYVSGFSGGGRVASMVSSSFPHIFKGALYNCGANFWDQVNEEQLTLIKNNRFVFLTGTQDFNLQDTKKVYSKYKRAGATNIKLMVIGRMGHSNPKRNKFAQAIDFLDNAE